MAKKESLKEKFPLLENVEYFDIIKNRTALKSYSGLEVNGLTWRQFQELIGKSLPAGYYHFNFKMTTESREFNGTIRAIGNKPEKTETKHDPAIDVLTKKIDSLVNNNQSNIGIETLLAVTKQGYEIQISFLNQQLQSKDLTIVEYKKEIA